MGHIIEMRLRTLVLAFLTVMCLNANAQAREPSESSLETVSSIYALPPFERAVCCIKYYEGMHRKKDYPYVGYGHKLRPGETYSSNMSLKEADALLRKDLQSLCAVLVCNVQQVWQRLPFACSTCLQRRTRQSPWL